MRSPQTLTSRIVPALAVTVVATLVLGAVVVTADATTDTAPLLPDTFGVAAPRQGDAWRYNVTLAGDWTFGGEDEIGTDQALPFLELQWAGSATVRGADGRMHDVNRLVESGLHYSPRYLVTADEAESEVVSDPTTQPEEGSVTLVSSDEPYWSEGTDPMWVLAGGQGVVSRGFRQTSTHNDTNYGLTPYGPVNLGVGATYTRQISEVGHVIYPQDEVPCLAFNPLQGTNVSLADDLALFAPCDIAGDFLEVPEGLLFHAAAIDAVQGVQAVRFDGRLNGTYSAWFTPAVPYPVRLEFSLPSLRAPILEEGDRDLPGARSAVVELVGFAAGLEELDAVDDADQATAAPDLQYAPTLVIEGVPVGPDETGITHPFPLSVAYTQALEAPDFANLRTFLAGKTNAYVAAAQYHSDAYNGVQSSVGDTDGWSIYLVGNDEDLVFTVSRNTLEGFTAMPQAQDAMRQAPMYSYQMGGRIDLPLYRRAVDGGAQAEMATVQSLFARWAPFDGSGLAPNMWGFAIGCDPAETAGEDCDLGTEYLVGHSDLGFGARNPQNTVPGGFLLPTAVFGMREEAHVERMLNLRDDGLARSMRIMDDRRYTSDVNSTLPTSGEPIPEPPASAEPGYSVQSVAVTGIPSAATKWIPDGKEAAGIGFMGLVVGALYWIWPKLGLMGLFSRLERGELLDHPARARLVQIVESQPGIHFHELATKAELANGTAVHHLRKLSDSGHVAVRRSGRYTCYFPGGRVDPHAAAAAPLLKSDGAKQVLEAVKARPGMSNLEVAHATGLQPSTVNYHVQRLSQAGLVAALRDGRMVRLHPGIRAASADGPAAAGAAA